MKGRISLAFAAVNEVRTVFDHGFDPHKFGSLRAGRRAARKLLNRRGTAHFGEVVTAQSDQLFLVREVAEDAMVKCGGFVGLAEFAIAFAQTEKGGRADFA